MAQRASVWLGGLIFALGASAAGVVACGSNDAGSTQGPVTSTDAGDAATAPDGDDEAGDEEVPQPQCDEYCSAIMSACPGTFGAGSSKAQYVSNDGCMNACNQLNAGDYTDPAGDDTLGCRLNQLKAGGAGCTAGGLSGGGVCNGSADPDSMPDAGPDFGRCQTFCQLTTALCNADNGVDPVPYADTDTCMAICGAKFKFDPGQPEYTMNGNTLNCRLMHLVLAYDATDGASAVYECQHLAFPASAFCQ